MAYYANIFSFLLLIVVFASVKIEARESKFFTKLAHFNINNKTNKLTTDSNVVHLQPATTAPAPAPAPTPTPATQLVEPPAQLGYGLYGHDSTEFPPTKTTTINPTDENEIPSEELKTESYNEYNGNNYNNNNGYVESYNNNNNGYVREPQGLSDTRFLEHGKYYFDAYNENNNYQNNGYAHVRGSGNNHEEYYGNGDNSKYEFNSMEEYDRQQGYPRIQGEYNP